MTWFKEIENPAERQWEQFYRNRFQHDKRVRTTHGVNCTGSCSWEVYVKDGIVTWETQATDYPLLAPGLPPYEPRGCQRGISYSWYLYSPMRVKYPYMRGPLLDLWKEARKQHSDPLAAWKSIQDDPQKRQRYQKARGKGGFRRVRWDDAVELIAAANLYTAKTYGPDRVCGFSPIPAMSQISYAAGSRYMNLLGGTVMSFYDWYCDLPPASPEIWGEQTDVQESADWYNSRYICVMGSNLNMTRTPDVHFTAEVRHAGAKLVVFAPDFNMVAKYADYWVPLNQGQDGAFWQAAVHVILKEYHADRQVPYFHEYVKENTDAPLLVELTPASGGYKAGRFVRAGALERYAGTENGDWKFLLWDKNSDSPRMPQGAMGHRWQEKKGQWNLKMEDGQDGSKLDADLTFIDRYDEVLEVEFQDFGANTMLRRGVPARRIQTAEGEKLVTTVFDLLLAQHGVGRGLPGAYPKSYDDDMVYTPAWAEKYTGIHRDTIIRIAREFAENGELTNGKNTIIVGAGINHWYHNNLMYRSAITALMFTGSIGVNGGGLAHYVGQEKLAPVASWSVVAMATDWQKPPRLMNSPSFHYVNSDQWRYERDFTEYAGKQSDSPLATGTTIDAQVRAVRQGWLPCYPQFNRNSLEVAESAAKSGMETAQYVAKELAEGRMKFSMEDPDAPENWPRNWIIWRGNAIGTSAKGHEYFMKHYLGTHTAAIAEEVAGPAVKEVVWRPDAPIGKMDLIVDLNFRMDTSALYSDIVLPAATWYEKNDMNSTDMHTFVNPLQQCVPPAWESKSDWDIFKTLAQKVSELAGQHFPTPVKDVVLRPLSHDTIDEIAQPSVRDWKKGECEPIPGKTMPHFTVIERDYANLYNRYVTLGPGAAATIGAHGIQWDVSDIYDRLKAKSALTWGGTVYPSLFDAVEVADMILAMAPETNGEVAYRAFEAEEKKVGLPLKDMAEDHRDVCFSFKDLIAQPRRVFTSPIWSAVIGDGRAYSPFSLNVERRVPWRTLTGRQQFYHDHEVYLAFGEHLPTYKTKLDVAMLGETEKSKLEAQGILLNYITPHGKWSIHSTYSDNHRMMTLSRGGYPIWLNHKDAEKLGVKDNDWIEAFNDNGVFVCRCIVSRRIPSGTAFLYHATERTVSVPKTKLRAKKRGGMNNSLTRCRLKPILMAGGYGQFTFGFNYWGPTGVNRDTFVFVRRIEQPDW